MRLLLFLSRLSFICSVFAIVALLMPWQKLQVPKELAGTVSIIGLFAYVLCPLVNICYLFLLLRRRLFHHMPRWLVLSNFIFLIVHIQYLLFQNDTFHT